MIVVSSKREGLIVCLFLRCRDIPKTAAKETSKEDAIPNGAPWDAFHYAKPIAQRQLGACNYPVFLSRRFHGPIYFYLELFLSNLSRIQIRRGASEASCNQKHGLMSTCSREAALFDPYRSVLIRRRCRLELAYLCNIFYY